MTPVESALVAILVMMALVWLACATRLSHQLFDRHPEKYDEMRLAQLWPAGPLEWFRGYNNARSVIALLSFVLGGEDAALHDRDISRLSTFMRWLFPVYVALFVSLVAVFVHRSPGDIASWGPSTVEQPQRAEAFRLHREERWEEAVASYDQLLQKWEPDAELHYYRGVVHWRLNHPDQALEDFRRVIELEPTHFDAHHNADRILSQQQRWGEVLEMWNAYIAKTPTDAKAYFERGGTNFRKGDLAAAQADAAQACRLGKAEGCAWEARLKARVR